MRKIAWSERARTDVRRIDRGAAMRIFTAIQRFAERGEGDVKELKGESGELRLRVGDYRVRFTNEARRHDSNSRGSAPTGSLAMRCLVARVIPNRFRFC
jgi:mRNA-degrading endonuclease RelE of RelBE toxin-antitoxin system